MWLLNKVSDRNGNYMTYHYDNDGESASLKIIYYTIREDQLGCYSVVFGYDQRNDTELSFIGDHAFARKKLLKTIQIKWWDQEMERYDFQYDGNCGANNSMYSYNRLSSIRYSCDGVSYNPTEIQWDGNNHQQLFKTSMDDDLSYMWDLVKFSGDFNGDGLSDFIIVSKLHKRDGEDEEERQGYGETDTIVQDTSDDRAKKWRTMWIHLNKGNTKTDTSDGEVRFELLDEMEMERLQWVYTCDIDGDGADEIVTFHRFYASAQFECYYEIHAYRVKKNAVSGHSYLEKILFYYPEWLYNSFVTIPHTEYSSESFSNRKQGHLITGDFLGNGTQDLILQMPKMNGNYPAFRHFHYDKRTDAIFMEKSNAAWIGTVFQAGDFDGDGKAEVWYANGDDDDKTGRIVKVYRNSQGVLSYYKVCDILSSNCSLFFGDFNGDGHTDILSYHDSDHPGGNTWSLVYFKDTWHHYPLFSLTGILNDQYHLGRPGDYSYDLESRETKLNYFLQAADMDGDGKSDLFARSGGNICLFYGPVSEFGQAGEDDRVAGRFRNIEVHTLAEAGFAQAQNHSICLGNFLGQENTSAINACTLFSTAQHSTYYNIASVTDGMGNRSAFEYGYLVHNPMAAGGNIYTFDKAAGTPEFSILSAAIPVRVLKTLTSSNVNVTDMGAATVGYRYADALVHRKGKGVLGFSATVQESRIAGALQSIVTTTGSIMPMERHCHLLPVSTEVVGAAGVVTTRTQYNYGKCFCARDMKNKTIMPVIINQKTDSYELLGEKSGAFIRTAITQNIYSTIYSFMVTGDLSYTDPVKLLRTTTGIHGKQDMNNATDCQYQTIVNTDYATDDLDGWLINRPLSVRTTKKAWGCDDIVSLTVYEYDKKRPHLLNKQTNHTSGTPSQWTTVSRFDYDALGNTRYKSLEAEINHQIVSRYHRYIYTDNGRFLKYEINALGDTTRYAFDQKHGQLTESVDCNGFATRYSNPDHLGIRTAIVHPDGTHTDTELGWVAGSGYENFANDLPSACYYSRKVTTGSAPAYTFYDAAGKELRTVSHGLTEKHIVYKDTRYDKMGRVETESLPYFKGENPQQTRYGYDEYSRVNKTEYPDNTFKTVIYNGLTTVTETDGGGTVLSQLTEKNIMGWTVRNSEHLGPEDAFVTYGHYADGKLAWSMVGDQPNTKVTVTYDGAGNRYILDDPDYGRLQTYHNAFGQVVSRTSSKGQEQYSYDVLGRMTKRVQADAADSPESREETVWEFYKTTGKRGLLKKIMHNGTDQIVTYDYDNENLNRLRSVTETRFGSQNYTTAYEYDDANGMPLRVAAVTYPTGYTLRKRYDANTGNLVGLADNNNHLLWETEDANALGQVTHYRMGDIAGTRTYSRLTNRLEGILEKKGENIIQDFTYTYDSFANLASRKDNRTNMTENFTYDGLNRLTGIWLNGKQLGGMTYDVHGRMLGKQSDGRTVFSGAVYAQEAFESKPHALRGARMYGIPFPTEQQSISYTMFDKAASITQGGASPSGGESHERSVSFRYGYDHQRTAMEETMDGTAWRSKVYAGHCEFDHGPDNDRDLTYLIGPLGVFAVYERSGPYYLDEESGWNASLHYILKDHLGSWTTVTNERGDVEQRLSFDAWGNLRNPDTWLNYSAAAAVAPLFDRGYTGHEHLAEFGLINTNGRMYDPVMSSFLSPDNYVQAPDFSQSFNRYAYCLNNPLRYVDPSGEIAVIDDIIIAAAVCAAINVTMNGISNSINNRPFFNGWGQAAIVGGLAGATGAGVAALGAGAAVVGLAGGAVSGGISAALNNGNLVQGVVIGGLSGWIGGGVGQYVGGGLGAFLGGAASNSTAQFCSLVVNGGQFDWKQALFSGGLSFGMYHAASYSNWQFRGGKKMGGVEVSYRQFCRMQTLFQRSRALQREMGGYLMDDGSFRKLPDGTSSQITFEGTPPEGAMAEFHTHWDRPGAVRMLNESGSNYLNFNNYEEGTILNHVAVTKISRYHGDMDFTEGIQSIVLNRYDGSYFSGEYMIESLPNGFIGPPNWVHTPYQIITPPVLRYNYGYLFSIRY